MTLRLPYFIIISLILIVGLVGNLFIWENTVLGLAFGLAYLIFFGLVLGTIFFPDQPTLFKLIYGFFFFISGISFFGAIIYYFYQLNNWVIFSLIIFIPCLLSLFLFRDRDLPAKQDLEPIQVSPHLLRTTFLLAAFVFLTILNFRFLINAGTVEAIRSPWKVIPFEFFITYFVASVILLFFIFKSQKNYLNLLLISLHTFVTVGLVLFVYQIGYGFDPFIHQITEKIIATEGLTLPKPFYYLGQYSLVVFLAKILFIPVEWIDKLLLPILISLVLPITIFFAFRPLVDRSKNITPGPSLIPLLILVLPFASFISTVPQGLANFYLLITIFLSVLVFYRQIPLPYLYFLAFTTLLIHPLAGIPNLIFVFLLTIFAVFKRQTGIFEFLRQIVFVGSFILAAIAIPFFLVAASFWLKNQGPALSLEFFENTNNLWKILAWSPPALVEHFNPLYDLVYTYDKNIIYLLVVVGFVGYFLLKKQLQSSLVYLVAFFALIINYILIKLFITFPFLIKYEQGVFPQRILEISFYFLIPLFLFALYKFFKKLKDGKRLLKFFFILFFGLALTFSLYLSYPRDDGEDYHIDRGYSVSASDIKAVHEIEKDAAGADYIVLANQNVSVAAVREFGFKKYYGPHFYYPIPTGDPLYQYYLKMVYEEPSRLTINEAANLTGVHLVYFVLNQYWTDFNEIVEAARPTADETIEIDNGKILIFKYQL